MAVDLSKYTMVLNEGFDEGLSLFDGTSGIWTAGPRRDKLVTNGPQSVFVSENTTTSDGKGVGLNPFSVKDGILSIHSDVIPDANKAAVKDALQLAGQGASANDVKYYTGMIATDQTWGQQYGYFEIRAEIPEGKGHWPAFWLAPAGEGWPPELDIFEAYGKGIGKTTGADDSFNVAVHFDEYDADGNKTQNVDMTNPYANAQNGWDEDPTMQVRNNKEKYRFGETIESDKLGADIYNGYWTWGASWTPECITYYFGKDADHMVEIFKAPTPQDAKAPMYIIANDQISSTFGWNPVAGEESKTFAADNNFNIDYIKLYALNPTTTLAATGKGATLVDGDDSTNIVGSTGNDRIVTGDGQDIVDLKGGTDTVFVERGMGNKILSNFGSDDRIVLEGFFIEDTADAIARLTQAGKDVWLANGADPANPQTISFKDTKVANFNADDFVVRWSVTQNIWSSALLSSDRLKDTDGDGIVKANAAGSMMTDVGSKFKGPLTLVGSDHGDRYYVYNSATKITEKAGGGVDTVYAYKSYTLSDNVENLIILQGKDGQTATGNALGNRLEGTKSNEIFTGAGGDDLIITGGGADKVIYRAGDGYDTVVGFGKDDVLQLQDIRFASFDELKARLTASGNDTLLDLGTGQSITFRGTKIGELGAANFAFQAGPTNVTGHGIDPFYMPSTTVDGTTPGTSGSLPGTSSGQPQAGNGAGGGAQPVPSPVQIRGDAGSNILKAASNADTTIYGGDGGDTIYGAGGHDKLYGDGGNDKIFGEAGNDTIYGAKGDDILNGGAGNDTLYGEDDADTISGNDGDDLLYGGAGNDRLRGGDGIDRLFGEAGDDTLNGGTGDDLLYGGAGNDKLFGEDGNDTLMGGDGNDTLNGGAGNDIINGGSGVDRLFGDSGADTFVISRHQTGDTNRIMDFSRAEGDRIDLHDIVSATLTAANFGDYIMLKQGRGGVDIYVDTDGAAGGHHYELAASVNAATMGDVQNSLIY